MPGSDLELDLRRRLLYDGPLLRVVDVAARPTSATSTLVQCADVNVLVLPVAGVCSRIDGSRRSTVLTPHHAAFMAAGREVCFGFPGGVGDRCLSLCWDDDALARAAPEALAGDGFDARAVAAHTLLSPASLLARSLLAQHLAAARPDALAVEELGVCLLGETVRQAHRRTARHSRARNDGARRRRQVERVQEAVALRPEQRWTLDDLAAVACVSPAHLARVFRAEVGTTVYEYVLRSRIASALDALLDSDAPLSSIALDAGFAHHSHFTARVRAFFGLTPAALRRARKAGAREQSRIVTALPTTTA
jgi:AraC family transcriptional regulator